MSRELVRSLVLLACVATIGGCPESHHVVDGDADGDGDGDGDSDMDCDCDGDGDGDWWWETEAQVVMPDPNKVDILFMVDNSNSMGEEQAVLREQMNTVIGELLSPSVPAAPVIDDLHIGVVTSDMGTGGYTIQTCSNPMTGDNGVLQNRDHGVIEGCEPTYSAGDCDRSECPWLSHSPEHPDDGTDPSNPPIWEDFGCVATLGTGGCGFEQQLESSLAALTVQAGPGMPNEGFLRPDSLLVVIYVTDEDDCSTGNAEMFNPAREDYGTLNVRCALNPDELYPIDRYHDAFIELRGGAVDRVLVAAIAGVPIDGSWNPGDPIEELRELQRVNPANPNELLPTCDTAMGRAYPPVRIAELAYSFGANGIIESICRQDWTPALAMVTRSLQGRVSSICADDSAYITTEHCRMVAVQADGAACPSLADAAGPGRAYGWEADLGLDGSGRRLCEILTADYDGDGCPDGTVCDGEADYPTGLQGWYFDLEDERCPYGTVRMTMPDLAYGAVELRIECRQYGD
jgi:hypothetical protein